MIKGSFHCFLWPMPVFIRITCPCNVYPLTPHFYIVKLEFTGVYILFLVLLLNTTIYVLSKIKKNVPFFRLKIQVYTAVKYCSIWACFRNVVAISGKVKYLTSYSEKIQPLNEFSATVHIHTVCWASKMSKTFQHSNPI